MNKKSKNKEIGKTEKKEIASKDNGGLLDMDQAIKLLKTSRPTFYRLLRDGKIKGMKVGRQWRFKHEDIERFLKGEEPKIELRADLTPLIEKLNEQLYRLDSKYSYPKDNKPITDENKVIDAVNLMLLLGIRMHASSIHIAPYVQGDKNIAILRYRADGVLRVATEIDIRLLLPIINRWKIMARCDIREEKIPLDGLIEVKTTEEGVVIEVDVRVTFMPTVLGQSLTAHISKEGFNNLLSVDQIGYSSIDKKKLLKNLENPWGIIFITGPAASGKTSVLYACIKHLSNPEQKIITVEGRIESNLPWTVQTQIRPDIGLTFPQALRATLRSEPNIIMVSDIQNLETLSMIQKCAHSGTLVLTSLLNTEDSAKALKMMVEMGSDPFLVGETTKLIVSQRLIRKLCPHCSTEDSPSQELIEKAEHMVTDGGLNWTSLSKKFKKSTGCSKCRKTGFLGRTIIAETLEVTPDIIKALTKRASVEELRAIAMKQGTTTIAVDGIRKAATGETTLIEVLRSSLLA